MRSWSISACTSCLPKAYFCILDGLVCQDYYGNCHRHTSNATILGNNLKTTSGTVNPLFHKLFPKSGGMSKHRMKRQETKNPHNARLYGLFEGVSESSLNAVKLTNGADEQTRTATACATAPSRRRVYQFHHIGILKQGYYLGISPAFDPSRPAGAGTTGATCFVVSTGTAGCIRLCDSITPAALGLCPEK